MTTPLLLHSSSRTFAIWLKKWTDTAHAKRSLTTKLYNLALGGKFTNSSALSQKVITYLVNCLSYHVTQNKGNPLALQTALESTFPHAFGIIQYAMKQGIKKLAPASNSQRNEVVNSITGSKSPKIRYYGGRESNAFRVACEISQANCGYNYISDTLKSLNIVPGEYWRITLKWIIKPPKIA